MSCQWGPFRACLGTVLGPCYGHFGLIGPLFWQLGLCCTHVRLMSGLNRQTILKQKCHPLNDIKININCNCFRPMHAHNFFFGIFGMGGLGTVRQFGPFGPRCSLVQVVPDLFWCHDFLRTASNLMARLHFANVFSLARGAYRTTLICNFATLPPNIVVGWPSWKSERVLAQHGSTPFLSRWAPPKQFGVAFEGFYSAFRSFMRQKKRNCFFFVFVCPFPYGAEL